MLSKLWIATKNHHKINEFKELLSDYYEIKSLNDLVEFQNYDIAETGKSFEENALLKARYLSEKLQQLVIADDSGLEINALDKFPGVYSARWMQEASSWVEINQKILDKMIGIKDRSCQYVCALALVDVTKNYERVFVGVCYGHISDRIKGHNGFGYDAIFFLPEYQKTCAELSIVEKNAISHRYQALKKLLHFIKTNLKGDIDETKD